MRHIVFGYKVRYTEYLGVLIYKIQSERANQTRGRELCDQDSEDAANGDAAVAGFLYLPRPRNLAENGLYVGLPSPPSADFHIHLSQWSDISLVSNRWVFRDGSPASWFNWYGSEPNGARYGENTIEIYSTAHRGQWNDRRNDVNLRIICSYLLPAGAENTCPWLKDFEDQ